MNNRSKENMEKQKARSKKRNMEKIEEYKDATKEWRMDIAKYSTNNYTYVKKNSLEEAIWNGMSHIESVSDEEQ